MDMRMCMYVPRAQHQTSACRRCIQRRDQPIILTGYAALNKLLGREVYSSQLQLGGPKVRCPMPAVGRSRAWQTTPERHVGT